MTQSFDLAELLALAKDNSPESRSRLFGEMGDLFLNKGGYLSAEERASLSEILSTLLPQADKDSRLKLAYDLSGSTAVPRELARLMAEDEIEVASPVLFKSAKLTDQDLIELAARSPQHAGVIATRRGLQMAVADKLMGSGNAEVVQAVLDNASAQISVAALHSALEQARTSDDLQDSISRRVELPEEIAAELMEWAGNRVRERLMDRFNILMVEISPSSEQEEEVPPLDIAQFNRANGIVVEPEPDLADLPPTGFARYGAASSTAPTSGVGPAKATAPATAQAQADAEEEARQEEARLAEAEALRSKAKKDLVAKTLAALAQDHHAEPEASATPMQQEQAVAQSVATPSSEGPPPVLASHPVETPKQEPPEFESEAFAPSPPAVKHVAAAERLTFAPVDLELELIDVGDAGDMPALALPMERTDHQSAMAAIEVDLELELEQTSETPPEAPVEPTSPDTVDAGIETAKLETENENAGAALETAAEIAAEEVTPSEPTDAVEPEPEAAALESPESFQPAEEPLVAESPVEEPSIEAPAAEIEAIADEPAAEQMPEPEAAPAPMETPVEAPAEVPAEAPLEAPLEAPAATEQPAEAAPMQEAEPVISEAPVVTPFEPRKEALVASFIKQALAAAAKALPGGTAGSPEAEHPTPAPHKVEAAAETPAAVPAAADDQPAAATAESDAEPEAAPVAPAAESAPEPGPTTEPAMEPADAAAERAPLPKGAEHKLTTTLVIAVLNSGGLARAEAMFAQMTGLRVGLVRRLAAESGGEGLAMAARAIHMSREDFSTIYLLWRKLKSRDGFVSTSDHGKALDFFDSAPQDRVMSVISRWRKDPEKLFATG